MSLPSGVKDVVWDTVEGLTDVWVDDIAWSSHGDSCRMNVAGQIFLESQESFHGLISFILTANYERSLHSVFKVINMQTRFYVTPKGYYAVNIIFSVRRQ